MKEKIDFEYSLFHKIFIAVFYAVGIAVLIMTIVYILDAIFLTDIQRLKQHVALVIYPPFYFTAIYIEQLDNPNNILYRTEKEESLSFIVLLGWIILSILGIVFQVGKFFDIVILIFMTSWYFYNINNRIPKEYNVLIEKVNNKKE